MKRQLETQRGFDSRCFLRDTHGVTSRLEDLSILVVDDDEDIRAGIAIALRSEGADVIQAADGNEAIALWRSHEPPIIVLDMMLPKRSGFLVLEELRETSTPPIVVMVTANEGRRHERYARTLGVHEYLTKPVPLETLIAAIQRLAGRSCTRGGNSNSAKDV
ncbi:MAG: response regulator [Planctomycetes bacterium]|nr:response regulator [Planctomycetota bacterium]MCP4838994.1 response regulator [Planctomycetota bacterium]